MSRPILLLRLEGPLQSWGTRSRWDVRDTQTEPTKSGIVGLLGCALGYPMYDPRLVTELDVGLRLGVRIEQAGRMMEDYQTITDILPTADGRYKHSGVAVGASLERIRSDPDATPATIVSPRFYLEDAAFLIALEERPTHPGLLARCWDALKAPMWPIYLGRKSCIPTRPVLEALTDSYNDIANALAAIPWEWRGAPSNHRAPASLVVIEEVERGPIARQDAIRINPARQYGFRQVKTYRVNYPGFTLSKGENT